MHTHREHVDRCERGSASPKKPQKDNIENNEHLKAGLHLTLSDGMRASAQAQTIKPGRLQLKELETLECFSAVDTLRGFFFFFVRAAKGSRGNAAPSFKQLCNEREADFGFSGPQMCSLNETAKSCGWCCRVHRQTRPETLTRGNICLLNSNETSATAT